MKKRLRKSIPVFLMFCTMLSGCASNNVHRDDKEPVKVTSILLYGDTEDHVPKGVTPENNSFSNTAMEKYNIKIDWLWIAPEEQYKQKLNVALASGDIPDFMAVTDEAVYRNLLENDRIMKWNDVLEHASEPFKEWIYRNPQALRAVTNENGDIMALPQYWDPKRKINIMMIRKDWLDELGLKLPETIRELEETAAAFQMKTGADAGIGLTHKVLGQSVGSMASLMNMFGSYPGAWVEENEELQPGEISPNTKSVLKTLNRFYENGILPKEFPLYDYSKLSQEVMNERLGIVIAPFWVYDSLIGKEIAKHQDSRWAAAPIPVADGTKGAVMDTVTIEKYWVISKECKNPEAVIKLFDLFVNFETDYPKEAKPENGFIWE